MHEEIKSLIQQSINLLERSSIWDGRASVDAESLGLLGEASRLRYLSRKAHMLVQRYQQCATALFSDLQTTTKLYPEPGELDFPGFASREACMSMMLQKLWTVYFSLHKFANAMVAANYYPLASWLFCFLDEILCIMEELHQAEREYSWAKWEYHHISRYQITLLGRNVQDKYACKEAEQGYKED